MVITLIKRVRKADFFGFDYFFLYCRNNYLSTIIKTINKLSFLLQLINRNTRPSTDTFFRKTKYLATWRSIRKCVLVSQNLLTNWKHPCMVFCIINYINIINKQTKNTLVPQITSLIHPPSFGHQVNMW